MPRMELIAGHAPDILVALGAEEVGGEADRGRFVAHLPLSGGMDPTWLDSFAEAARSVLASDTPRDFLDARIDLGPTGDRLLTIERVDPAWISAVARIPDRMVDALAGQWIDRLEDEIGALPGEEKPWIRELAGQVVAFCRTADAAPDVVFVWALGTAP
jgi:hypothetical protein